MFLLFFVLFGKTVMNTHKRVDNKAPGQILPYSDNTLFRNKAGNSGHSRAAQPTCSENRFVEKSNQ